uniref:hypothetical protein n=1 Tax=Bacillus multifaciens TaxID=3068506 RepID=UPI003F4932D8
MKNVMIRAWEIAKEAFVKFGGKTKEFFAQSLKLAWKEIKEDALTVEEKIAQTFEVVAALNKVTDLTVAIKFWTPGVASKERIYFNIGGTRKDLDTFYYAIAEDAFYSTGSGNSTKHEAAKKAIKVARTNIAEIVKKYVPAA